MKKLLLLLVLFIGSVVYSQCTNAPYGQWPTFNIQTQNQSCDGTFYGVGNAWSGEYSTVNVVQGNIYLFDAYSSFNDYFVTIADNIGNIIYTFGTPTFGNPLQWVSPFTGTIRFYSHLNSGCNFNTANSVRAVACIGSVLPVELSSFTLNCESTLTLNWTTESENNSSHWEIQASYDGENFIIIDTLSGQGNKTSESNYTYRSKTEYNYYRLKQIDFDGQYEYFGPLSTDCETDKFKVFPNPVTDKISITGNSSQDLDIEILDMSGKTLYSDNFYNDSNIIYKEIDVAGLKPGAYIIKVNNQFFKVMKN